MRRCSSRCAIEPGFFLLAAALAYLLPLRLGAFVLLAAAAHEAGHLAALRAVGVRGAKLRLGAFGAVIDAPSPAGWRAAAVILAGPAVNLAMAALPGPAEFRAVSLLLGGFNLLPVRPLDGGGLLLLLFGRFSPAPERALALTERAFLGAVMGAALWVGFRFSLGVAPLLAAGLVAARLLAEKQVAKREKGR